MIAPEPERRVTAPLIALAIVDLVQTVRPFARPDLWLQAFHGADRVDPQHLLRTWRRLGAGPAGPGDATSGAAP